MTDLAALNIHFTPEEFAGRRAAALALMRTRGLDGLLMFRQESMYYLTGYDTFGYVYFQCLWLGSDGRMTLLTRAPDRLQARFTSVIQDIRIWTDQAGADPFAMLKDILAEHGAAGRKAGCGVGRLWPDRPQRPTADRRAGRLLHPDRRVRSGQPASGGEKQRRTRLCPPGRRTGRRRADGGRGNSRAGRFRGRHPRRDAECGVPGRRRRSGE